MTKSNWKEQSSESEYEEDFEQDCDSPKQVKKDENKYYQDLEESAMLKEKQSMNDPLKEFYELQATLKSEKQLEDEQQEFFNEFGGEKEQSPHKRKQWGGKKA